MKNLVKNFEVTVRAVVHRRPWHLNHAAVAAAGRQRRPAPSAGHVPRTI